MQVRAKFRVQHIDETSVTLDAVSRDGENKDWSKYTPWGQIKMGITNPSALAQFEVGGEYTVDFNKVGEV